MSYVELNRLRQLEIRERIKEVRFHISQSKKSKLPNVRYLECLLDCRKRRNFNNCRVHYNYAELESIKFITIDKGLGYMHFQDFKNFKNLLWENIIVVKYFPLFRLPSSEEVGVLWTGNETYPAVTPRRSVIYWNPYCFV